MTSKTAYYHYHHAPGYGRDDHMAGEVIARAARQLGYDTDHLIAQHMGLAAHAVPIGSCDVRVPATLGVQGRVRRRMTRALARAYREFARRPDCTIYVALCRPPADRAAAELKGAKA